MRQLNSKAYLEHFAIPVDLMLYCVGQDTQVNISGNRVLYWTITGTEKTFCSKTIMLH